MQPLAIPCPNRTWKMALSETSLPGGSRDLRPADLKQETDCPYCFMQVGISLNSWVSQSRSKNGWYNSKFFHWDLHASTFAQLSPTLWSSTATTKSESARTGRGLQEIVRQGGCGPMISRQNGKTDRWEACYANSSCLVLLTAPPFSWFGASYFSARSPAVWNLYQSRYRLRPHWNLFQERSLFHLDLM